MVIEVTLDSDNSATSFFPSPEQVAATDPSMLRSAGLSGRKGEYGLSFRFNAVNPR